MMIRLVVIRSCTGDSWFLADNAELVTVTQEQYNSLMDGKNINDIILNPGTPLDPHFPQFGKEAEELRSGIESILEEYQNSCDKNDSDYVEFMCYSLRRLLDDVDARDSLTYLENNNVKNKL